MAHLLQVRGLFGGSDDSNFTCAHPEAHDKGEPLSIGITFQWLMIYIIAGALGLTTMSALLLIWKHLHRYTRPREQRQNVRIIAMPVIFSIVCLLSVLFYSASIYIKPLIEVYEAFCVAALFLLYLEYVCPNEAERSTYFFNLPAKDKKGNTRPGGSLQWYNYIYLQAMQFPLTKTIAAIVEIVTQAADRFCSNSLSPRYAHIWLLLIDIFIIGGAIQAVIRFYKRLKKEMVPEHHALGKLISLKGIVIFLFLQEILFGFLNSRVFTPSATYTYDDIFYGIPMMLCALESLLFSLLFHWAYRSREYRSDGPRMPVWRAVFDAMNLTDIVQGVFRAFYLLFTGQGHNPDKKRRGGNRGGAKYEPIQYQQGYDMGYGSEHGQLMGYNGGA
ncbi:hypothetical protein CLAIMM_14986 [Cladophialophora immunda]|nr:hypothetical protein CLAIMM_14986 [Cladophialophora immunda]